VFLPATPAAAATPGQGSGRGSGGHRRPQPGTRHCERHEHAPVTPPWWPGRAMRSSG